MTRYCLLLLIVLISTGASAQTYQWVDKNGVVHLSDTPPPGEVKNVKITKDEDVLSSSKLIFLNKLYSRESFEAEKDRLQKSIRFFEETCRTDAKKWGKTPEHWDAYCENNAKSNQRALTVLTSDPDRYFYVKEAQRHSGKGPTLDSPFYRPWE